jgi:hypothetical protein
MWYRSDVQRDAAMQTASVGKHLNSAVGTGCRDDCDEDEEGLKRWPFGGLRCSRVVESSESPNR